MKFACCPRITITGWGWLVITGGPDITVKVALWLVTLPAGFEQDLTGAIGKLAEAEGFQAHSHRLDVLGVCAACR